MLIHRRFQTNRKMWQCTCQKILPVFSNFQSIPEFPGSCLDADRTARLWLKIAIARYWMQPHCINTISQCNYRTCLKIYTYSINTFRHKSHTILIQTYLFEKSNRFTCLRDLSPGIHLVSPSPPLDPSRSRRQTRVTCSQATLYFFLIKIIICTFHDSIGVSVLQQHVEFRDSGVWWLWKAIYHHQGPGQEDTALRPWRVEGTMG